MAIVDLFAEVLQHRGAFVLKADKRESDLDILADIAKFLE